MTCQVFSYTNHTLMSEALETWPVDMLGKILPRHLQIIFEINDYFLKTLQEQVSERYRPSQPRTSIIDESNGRRVRMAWLAVVVSPRSTGCPSCIPRLMVESLFAEFAKIFPNALYQRDQRCDAALLAGAGPTRRCRKVLDEHIRPHWRTDLSQLDELKQHIDYPMVNQAVRQARV